MPFKGAENDIPVDDGTFTPVADSDAATPDNGIHAVTPGAGKSFLHSALNGAFGGGASELVTAGDALVHDPLGFLKGDVSDPALATRLVDDYDRSKGELKNEAATHPYASMAGSIGGAVAAGAATGGIGGLADGAAEAAPGLARFAQPIAANFAKAHPRIAIAGADALLGAGGSGLYSFDDTQGDASNRFDAAVPAAIGGGVLGPVGGAVARPILRYGAKKLGQIADAGGDLMGMFSADDPVMGGPSTAATPNPAAPDPFAPPPDPIAPADPATPDPITGGASQADIADAASTPDPVQSTPSASILTPDDLATLQDGRTIPLTAGERTGNINLQKNEDDALKLGDPLFQQAKAQQQDAIYKPFENALNNGDILGVNDKAAQSGDIDYAEKMADLVRGNYDSLGSQVKSAYKAADNAAANGGKPVEIDADAMKQNFRGPVDTELAAFSYKPGDIPKLEDHLDAFDKLFTPGNNGTVDITSAKLGDLNDWYQRLNRLDFESGSNFSKGPGGGTQAVVTAVRNSYKNAMANLSDDAIVNGDDTAIAAFKNATSLAKERFGIRDSATSIKNILENRQLNGEQLANVVYGAAKMSSKADNGDTVNLMLRAAGDAAPAMQDALKKGLMARVLQKSMSSTLQPEEFSHGTDRAYLNANDLVKNLNDLINRQGNGRTFQDVFHPDEQAYLKQFLADLRLVRSKQPGAVQGSNNWVRIASMLNEIPVVNKVGLPGLSLTDALKAVAAKGAEKQIRGKAVEGLSEFDIPGIIKKQLSGAPAYYGYGAGTGIGNAIFGDQNGN